MVKILLIVLFTSYLFGFDDFNYHLEVSSKDVVIKEAVILSVVLKQTNNDDVMHFDFTFPSNPNYKIILLESDESKDEKGCTLIRTQYVLYPLKKGMIKIKPHLTIKKASKEELKKFVTGSADELMYLQTQNKNIELDTFSLNAKNLDKDIVLVGNYALTYKIDKNKVISDNQVNITYTLSGEGYKPSFDTLLGDVPHADIFLNKEVFDKKLFHKCSYIYAIHGSDDFVIPQISLVGYNPKSKKRYVLKVAPIPIDVEKNSQTDNILIENTHYSFEWRRYFDYLLLFIAGFFTQKLWKKLPKKQKSKEQIFVSFVKKCKNPKELLHFLLLEDNIKFKHEIEVLEEMAYQGKTYQLSSVKSRIIKRFFTIDENFI